MWRRPERKGRLACWLALTALAATTQALAADTTDAWVVVRINGVEQADPSLLHESDDAGYYVSQEDFSTWNLPEAAVAGEITYQGRRFLRITSRPGMIAARTAAGDLDLNVDPWLYDKQQLRAVDAYDAPVAGELAVVANYDVYTQFGSEGIAAGQLELQASRGRYVLSNRMLAGGPLQGGVRRLDTGLRIDMPEHRATLALGDTVTSTVASARALRFAGLQWATDFATQPDYVTFAMPSAQGVAVMPSAVDLYVDGTRVAHRDVNAGPFSIYDVPVPMGSGRVELRLRDALGREQIVSQSFLTAPELLRPGLSAGSLEIGALRQNYGSDNGDYGALFAAVAGRRGITERMTVEGGVESTGEQSTGRVGGVLRAGGRLMLRAGIAMSHDLQHTSPAADLSLGFVLPQFEIGSELRLADRHFSDLTTLGSATRQTYSWSTQLSVPLPRGVSTGLVHAQRRAAGAGAETVSTLNINSNRVGPGALSGYISRVATRHAQDTLVGLIYTTRLGTGISASSGVSRNAQGTTLDLRAGQSADRTQGLGWDAAIRSGDSGEQRTVRLRTLTGLGDGELQLASYGSSTALAAAWHGAAIWSPQGVALAPAVTGAVGLIDVPGAAGVSVFQDGQLLGKTDEDGRLVATRLRSYEVNTLRVDITELPLTAWVGDGTVRVRPYAHNVLHLAFAVRAESANFSLRRSNGQYVPAGAVASHESEDLPVGDTGLTVLPHLRDATWQVSWDGGGCAVAPTKSDWDAASRRTTPLVCIERPALASR